MVKKNGIVMATVVSADVWDDPPLRQLVTKLLYEKMEIFVREQGVTLFKAPELIHEVCGGWEGRCGAALLGEDHIHLRLKGRVETAVPSDAVQHG